MCKLSFCTKIDRIHSYYDQNFENADENYKILGWESREAHYARFSILCDNLSLSNKSLLDVGCGFGDLYRFVSHVRKEHFTYFGLDISPRMVEEARRQNPGTSFSCRDIFSAENTLNSEKYDIIYSSGIFNLSLGNNLEFLTCAIDKFNSLSNEAFAFTLLSHKSTDKESTYYYYDPDEISPLLSGYPLKEIRIIEGYLPNDFTVICIK